MPEGPEIRIAADKLASALHGKNITHIFFAFDSLKKHQPHFQNQKIIAIESRGKSILTHVENGMSIYSHNQLYGRWVIIPNGPYPDSTRQLRLAIHTDDKMALLYSASEIEVLDTQDIESHPYLHKLGPELLSSEISLAHIIARFEEKSFHNRCLMSLLQDQSFISGIGNYLCCEALHLSNIWPRKRLADLTLQQRNLLAENCYNLTLQSYKTSGITNSLKRAAKLLKEGKNFEEYRFMVFRRKNKPCYRCGTYIVKEKICGKVAYICPSCQTK